MKRKTYILCWLALPLLCVLALVIGRSIFVKPPITLEAYVKIERDKTTRQEVEAILGQPTGSLTRQEYEAGFHVPAEWWNERTWNTYFWRGTGGNEAGTIYVMFDGDGIVVNKFLTSAHDPSLVDKIEKW